MEMRTENVEMILNGNPVHLSNDDVAYIVVELVEEIEKLKTRMNSLEGELYAQNQPEAQPKIVSSIVDGTRIWHLEGEL